jgi:L-asparagine transporter-like permease
MLHSLAEDGYAPARVGRLSSSGVPRDALVLSAIGLALAAVVSVVAADSAYVALFGVSIFGALVVWILILLTHWKFRRTRQANGEPDSPVRLWGARVTVPLAIVFLAAVTVSTPFIDGLQSAWKAGVPFFVLLSIAYLVVRRREVRDR